MAKNLFVGSLPFTTTEDSLGQLFAGVGQVQSVAIIKDKYTGKSRGFGFVEMVTEEDAKKAIEKLNDANVEGRNIVVKERFENFLQKGDNLHYHLNRFIHSTYQTKINDQTH